MSAEIAFTIPENPDPEVLAHPYFIFADVVGLPMERLDQWYGDSDHRHRTMYLVDTDGGIWAARGELREPRLSLVTTPDSVRAWARSKGLSVGTRGRVPLSLQHAYSAWVADYLGPWPTTFTVISTPEAGS